VISGNLNPSQLDALQRRLGAVYHQARQAVDLGVRQNAMKLASYIQNNKLSGQDLRVRTGMLKRSLNPPIFESDADTTTGIIGRTMPTYGKAWEVGFSGSVMVRAHQRMMKTAFGRPVKDPRAIMVQAHATRVNMPAKHFLANSAAEQGPQIAQDIRRRVQEAVKS
jgi:hypothetical protein